MNAFFVSFLLATVVGQELPGEAEIIATPPAVELGTPVWAATDVRVDIGKPAPPVNRTVAPIPPPLPRPVPLPIPKPIPGPKPLPLPQPLPHPKIIPPPSHGDEIDIGVERHHVRFHFRWRRR